MNEVIIERYHNSPWRYSSGPGHGVQHTTTFDSLRAKFRMEDATAFDKAAQVAMATGRAGLIGRGEWSFAQGEGDWR